MSEKTEPKPERPSDWKEKAFELFMEGKSLGQISKIIHVPTGTLNPTARDGHWNDKRRFARGESVKITQELIDQQWRMDNETTRMAIRNLIASGKRIGTAAALFGFTAADVKGWMRDDEDFARRIYQAVSLFECNITDKIKDFEGRDWKPSQFLLETHEELRSVYRQEDDKNKLNITVNLERPAIAELPTITIDNTPKLDVQDAEYVEVVGDIKQLPKPLQKKLKPVKTPVQLEAERVEKHNRKVLKQREEMIRKRKAERAQWHKDNKK